MTDLLTRLPLPDSPPWPEVSPLKDHRLAVELDVPGRLQWINDFLSRRRILEGDQVETKYFAEVLARIDDRLKETRLFLGVVGEFSSGKSTLINALVRQKLLRSDILQGTTAAATLIGFGKDFSVTVRRKQKNLVVRAAVAVKSGFQAMLGAFRPPVPPPSKADLFELLQRSTSDEEFAKDIVQVDVLLPSDSLTDGLVIVDTPGANANNPRHGEVTACALRDICDAAIIAVPADAAGSESLFKYLELHAKELIHRCIFLVTKVDLLRRERDRSLVIDNLRARINAQFGLANPRVLAAAPQFIVETLPNPEIGHTGPIINSRNKDEYEFSSDEIAKWTSHFESMEIQLRQILKEKRLQSIADDIGILLERLFRRLTDKLESRLQEYRSQHEALEKLVIPNIHGFIAPKRDGHVQKATSSIQRLIRQLPNELESIKVNIVGRLHDKVNGASNTNELKTVMESGVPNIMSSGEAEIRRHVEKLVKKIAQIANHELKGFHDEFQNHYRSLATLGGKLQADAKQAKVVLGQFANTSSQLSADLAAGVAGVRDEQTNRVIGGGAAGAVLGTILLPGVGTVLGAAVGSFFSSMFGPSLDEIKSQCWPPLRARACNALDEANSEIISAVNEVGKRTVIQLTHAIDEYAPKYEHLVEQMKVRDAQVKKQLLEMERETQLDLAAINKQREILTALQKKIRDM